VLNPCASLPNEPLSTHTCGVRPDVGEAASCCDVHSHHQAGGVNTVTREQFLYDSDVLSTHSTPQTSFRSVALSFSNEHAHNACSLEIGHDCAPDASVCTRISPQRAPINPRVPPDVGELPLTV